MISKSKLGNRIIHLAESEIHQKKIKMERTEIQVPRYISKRKVGIY